MEAIHRLKEMIDKSNRIVFFGGAGVSTESGIPDFRSKDGLYNQHDVAFEDYEPEYLLSRTCLHEEPKVFFEFFRQKLDTRTIQPNVAHKYLALLERRGKLTGIVTQNIDGLHQKAGSKSVYEIHGSALRCYCMKCGKKYDENYIFNAKDAIPRCDCRGIVRPEVTLYGEGLPEGVVEDALTAIASADMMIIGGTSLSVYPAASFIRYFGGRNLCVINRDVLQRKLGTEDLFIQGRIGQVFTELATLEGTAIPSFGQK